MPIFQFQGVAADGSPRLGAVEAGSRQEALQKLLADRVQPVSLVAAATAGDLGMAKPSAMAVSDGVIRLRPTEIIEFTEELVDFLDSGLQLEAALQIIETQEVQKPKNRLAARLRARVREGTEFSTALRASSPSFGELYCSVVEAGEMSGVLATLLRRQVRYLQAAEELRQRVQMALIYPAFLLGAAALAILVFMGFLVPQMNSLLIRTGGSLPWSTILLLRTGQFLQSYGLPLLGFAALAGTLFYFQIQRPEGRRWWDETKLKTPLWGHLLHQAFQAQFCQTLANLLQNGVALHPALTLLGTSVQNTFHRELIDRLLVHLREGISLTKAMKKVGYFSSTLRDLLIVGEQTGELGPCLERVGQRYEKIMRQQIERIMALIQPAIVVSMGLMVFLIAWSIMSGIFQTMQNFQKHH